MRIPKDNEPDIPFYFRLAQTAYTLLNGARGEKFIYRKLEQFNLLDRAGRFEYFDKKIYIPLRVPETLYVHDFSLFHGLREINFAHAINNNLEGDFTLIDGGAYFGQISMRLGHLCPNLKRIVSIEANNNNCTVLEANLRLLGIEFMIHNCAISETPGNGKIVFPTGESDPDSAYIESCVDGPIKIQSIDSIIGANPAPSDKNIALKLDIEGHEEAAINGAREIIEKAARVCYFIELHPMVLRRNKRTAEGILRAAERIRPTTWHLAHDPSIKINSKSPIFEQIGKEVVCDIIGISDPNVASHK